MAFVAHPIQDVRYLMLAFLRICLYFLRISIGPAKGKRTWTGPLGIPPGMWYLQRNCGIVFQILKIV